jgi:hypothetical protein
LHDQELAALILNFLDRRGRWGNSYFPLKTMVNWLSQAVKNDGKKIKKALKKLISQNLVLSHKKGNTVSLNCSKKGEIREIIAKSIRKEHFN